MDFEVWPLSTLFTDVYLYVLFDNIPIPKCIFSGNQLLNHAGIIFAHTEKMLLKSTLPLVKRENRLNYVFFTSFIDISLHCLNSFQRSR